MSAQDNLSPDQFFHGTKHEFSPGEVLTREGAWRAILKNRGHSDEGIERLAEQHRRFNFEDPKEQHLYYADHSLLGADVANMYAHEGHIYAVQPETSNGRKITKHSPDPHYKSYGGGAYRTTGRLRILHEVNEKGEQL